MTSGFQDRADALFSVDFSFEENVGFEPTDPVSRISSFQNWHNKPLCQFSIRATFTYYDTTGGHIQRLDSNQHLLLTSQWDSNPNFHPLPRSRFEDEWDMRGYKTQNPEPFTDSGFIIPLIYFYSKTIHLRI